MSNNDAYEYECALSGLTAPGEIAFSDDGLDDLPAGWIEVRMSRRVPNPRWRLIQQVKEAMLEGLIGQMPPSMREPQRVVVALQLDAQFYPLEQDTPPYITTTETVYLAPPEVSEDVREAVDQVREMMGMDPIELMEDEESEPEPEPAPAPKQVEAAPAKKPARAAKTPKTPKADKTSAAG